MPFYFRIPLPGPFGYSVRIGGKKRRRPATRPSSSPPAPRIATEVENERLRQALRHAIERADQDAFDLAIARYVDLATTKAGADDLGSLGQIRVLPDDESRALKGHLQVITDCLGHPEKLATAQAAAEQYNLLADRANRRVDMMTGLGSTEVSDEDRLERIEVS